MMRQSAIPRRTMQELIVRYRLEPTLRDLYVEGHQDRKLFDWYLRDRGHSNVSVFEIGQIQVSHDLLEAFGLHGGNRDRVLALALTFDEAFPATLPSVRCVADSDFDFLLGSSIEASHLLHTDYTSIELYTYNHQVLGLVLVEQFGLPSEDVRPLLVSMAATLRQLFVVRAANHILELDMRLVQFVRCCQTYGTAILFRETIFVDRCLNSAKKSAERTNFAATCNRLASSMPREDRQCMHGHDYLELVGWYVNKTFRWSGYRTGEASMLPLLTGALDSTILSSETLFRYLDGIYG